MKYVIFCIAFLSMVSCGNTEEVMATVVKDCSGTYLRKNNVDYKVCNENELILFEDGTRISAKVKDIYECKDTTSKCIWYHPYAKSVKIQKIIEE